MDVSAGQETEFLSLAMQFEALMLRKQYGRAELVRDEASPRRFYAVRYWTDTAAAASCHADPDAQALIAMIDTIASVTQLVNGTRPQGPSTWLFDERRARLGADRRSGFDRHGKSNGPEAGERRSGPDRRLAALRLL